MLFDTRSSNVRALVTDRYVVGTGDIDREHFAVPWESLQMETHGCCNPSATSGSDITNSATPVNASS